MIEMIESNWENLLEMWANKSGRIIIIAIGGIVALVFFGLFLLVRDHLRRRKVSQEFKRHLAKLAVDQPALKWESIEFRVRAASEAFFEGDESELLRHVNAELFSISEESARFMGLADKVTDFFPPAPFAMGLEETGLPWVNVMLGFRVPTGLEKVYKDVRFHVTVSYHEDGRWLVTFMEPGTGADFEFPKEAKVQVTDDMRLPSPHRETLNPYSLKRIRPSDGAANSFVILYALPVAFSILLTAINGSIYLSKREDEFIHREGKSAMAKVTAHELDETLTDLDGKTALIKYELQLPGHSETYVFARGILRGTWAYLPLETGKEAIASGQIPVRYLEDNPTKNVPEAADPNDKDALLLALAIVWTATGLIFFAARKTQAKIRNEGVGRFWRGVDRAKIA